MPAVPAVADSPVRFAWPRPRDKQTVRKLVRDFKKVTIQVTASVTVAGALNKINTDSVVRLALTV